MYDDVDFRMRFQFSRQFALNIIADFREELERDYHATDMHAALQILIALWFFLQPEVPNVLQVT